MAKKEITSETVLDARLMCTVLRDEINSYFVDTGETDTWFYGPRLYSIMEKYKDEVDYVRFGHRTPGPVFV